MVKNDENVKWFIVGRFVFVPPNSSSTPHISSPFSEIQSLRQLRSICSLFKRNKRHGRVFELSCQQDRTRRIFVIFPLSEKSDCPLAKRDLAMVLFRVDREFALQERRCRGGRGWQLPWATKAACHRREGESRRRSSAHCDKGMKRGVEWSRVERRSGGMKSS